MPRHKSAPSWDMMLPELLGRCFNLLEDEERCRLIPLVSKAFRSSHLSHPPRTTEWICTQWLTHSRVKWFHTISRRLERIVLELPEFSPYEYPEPSPYRLLDLLEIADLLCLRRFKFWASETQHAAMPPLLRILGRLNLQKVFLRNWIVSSPDRVDLSVTSTLVSEFRALSSLTSVESLHLGLIGTDDITEEQADALWVALAPLQNLRILNIQANDVGAKGCYYRWKSTSFSFQGVSALTQIRHFLVDSYRMCFDAQNTLDPLSNSFQCSTQLESLRLLERYESGCHSTCFRWILALTQLKVLWLDAWDGDDWKAEHGHSMDLSPLRHLTSLRLSGWSSWEIDVLIPDNMPALPNLRHLALRNMGLESFPSALARALKSLTILDLSHNYIPRLLVALTELTALLWLDLTCGLDLQLVEEDMGILQRIPALQGLKVKGCPDLFDSLPERSVAVLKSMCSEFNSLPGMPEDFELSH